MEDLIYLDLEGERVALPHEYATCLINIHKTSLGAREMAQLIKVPVSKPDDLGSISRNAWQRKRTDFRRVFSDLQRHIVACMCVCTHKNKCNTNK